MASKSAKDVAIIMGSQSDWPTMKHAADTLVELGISHEALIVSAHRTPDRLYRFAHRGAFERLVVVAPPKVLGDLRSKLHKEVDDRVVAEIPKTLTNHPVDQNEALVASALHGT